ncbi:MAG TPA: SPOR domain-containing protein, partial [Bryobacterales bacterium]|nr:SPOR domain-containing protein [Bryobacterales bacterium]
EIEGRGTYYRLRLVGFGENRKLARRLCARLKRRGTSCLVTRAGS